MPAATSSSKLPAHREHALARLDRYLEAALRAHAFPGAVVAFGHADEAPTVRCYGHLAYEASAPVTPGTRYDLLCMTKPMSIASWRRSALIWPVSRSSPLSPLISGNSA